MAGGKKDQWRIIYAYASMHGSQARKDGKKRAVPPYWEAWRDAWLHFDGAQLDDVAKAKPISDQIEAEVDETAVGPSAPTDR